MSHERFECGSGALRKRRRKRLYSVEMSGLLAVGALLLALIFTISRPVVQIPALPGFDWLPIAENPRAAAAVENLLVVLIQHTPLVD